MVSEPGAVWISVRGVTLPVSRASADGEGLERRARLEGVGHARGCAAARRSAARGCSGCRSAGWRAPAPRRVRTSSTTIAPALARCASTAALSAPKARFWILLSSASVQVVPVLRGADRLDVLDDAAEPVLDHAAAARGAGEQRLVRELDAFLAGVVDAGEADHVRHGLAARVVAAELALLVDAGDAQRARRAPPPRAGSGASGRRSRAIGVGELARELARVQREQRGERSSAAPASRSRPPGSPTPTSPASRRRAPRRCDRGCGRAWPALSSTRAVARLALFLQEVGVASTAGRPSGRRARGTRRAARQREARAPRRQAHHASGRSPRSRRRCAPAGTAARARPRARAAGRARACRACRWRSSRRASAGPRCSPRAAAGRTRRRARARAPARARVRRTACAPCAAK